MSPRASRDSRYLAIHRLFRPRLGVQLGYQFLDREVVDEATGLPACDRLPKSLQLQLVASRKQSQRLLNDLRGVSVVAGIHSLLDQSRKLWGKRHVHGPIL